MNLSISSSVVRCERLILQDESAFLRSWDIAMTAREGVFATEQADFTETHTPCSSSIRRITSPFMPFTEMLSICGTASSGLFMRIFLFSVKCSLSLPFSLLTRSYLSSYSQTAYPSAAESAAAAGASGVPLR